MGAMEILFLGSPTTIAPLVLRNLVSSIFVLFDNSLLHCFSRNHKLVQLIRSLLLSSFLFFLRLLPSLIPAKNDVVFPPTTSVVPGDGDSGIARALSQLLSIANDIPVSSRKYDVVRSLAEKVINDNESLGFPALREVNRAALSAAFERTIGRLEAVVVGAADDAACGGGTGIGRAARAAWARVGIVAGGGGVGRVREVGPGEPAAEKMAAELMWLARKMAGCGCVEEAVWRWASAAELARLGVAAEPRLQCSLVKLSAFLCKQGKEMGLNEEDETKRQQYNQMKMTMLQSWLPLMCRAINGMDEPVLSSAERSELERVLEEMIETLENEDQREKVLTLWLHHFTLCSSSDWPNLHTSYARWCDASRKLLINQT